MLYDVSETVGSEVGCERERDYLGRASCLYMKRR